MNNSKLNYALTLVAVALQILASACSGTDGSSDAASIPTHDRESINGLGVAGVLRAQDGCIYLEMRREEVSLVFPEGYTRVGDTILDADGAIVAEIGDSVESGGTLEADGAPCATPSGSRSVLFMGGLGPVEPED